VTTWHLVEGIDRIRHIPAAIAHGSYDVVCPAQNAWDLAQAWPEATLNIVEGAGRSVEAPGILSAVIDAVDGYAARRV
jgi:proline iminopeptidase